MIGSLIGAGIGAIGSIFGGISASKAMRERRRNIQRQQDDNRRWYEQRYNEDATQRTDALAMLERTRDALRKRNQRAAGVQAVMGGTEESVASERQAGNDALASVVSQIASDGARRRDQIEAQYQARNDNYQAQLNDAEAQRANATTQAIQGVLSAGANVASAVDGAGAEKKKTI